MANSYIAIPNVLPGNVSVGGNLSVTGNLTLGGIIVGILTTGSDIIVGGNTVRIGAASPYVRLQKIPTASLRMGYNREGIAGVADNGAVAQWMLDLTNGIVTPEVFRINAAGNNQIEAMLSTILTDYTNHAHTGTTTQDTIYSKTLRANLLGANGALRIKIGLAVTTQGATPTNLRINLAGNQLMVWAIAAGDASADMVIEALIFNQNSASAQAAYGMKISATGGAPGAPTPQAVNTAADQTLVVTVQNGAGTDNQTFKFVSMELVNTFGPVT